MAYASSRNDSNRNMVVIGKTGNGKSATCNTILGGIFFEVGEGGLSKTNQVQWKKAFSYGRQLTMIDTPGTMDVFDKYAALKKMESALDDCPEGFDAFLLVLRYDVRVTEEELNAAELAIKSFGRKAYQRTIVVYTHCEKFNKDKKGFEKEISDTGNALPRLKQLLSSVGNRVVMLDNRKDCKPKVKKQQVNDLLMLVDVVAKQNRQRFKRNDQESISDANNELALISSDMKQAQVQMLQMSMEIQKQQTEHLLMMMQMMLKMHATEFGKIMEEQRNIMRETLDRELKNQRMEMQKKQQGNDESSNCSIL